MGMPRTGSRKVEVGGDTYLWRIRGDSYSRRWFEASPIFLTLTCQRGEERPGRVLQVTLQSRHPPKDTPDYDRLHQATLFPREVRQIIAHALSKGWDPSERGAAFELQSRARQPQPSHYEIIEPLIPHAVYCRIYQTC